MHRYPGAQHGFNAPWAATCLAPDAADAWRRTIAILRQRVAPRGTGMILRLNQT